MKNRRINEQHFVRVKRLLQQRRRSPLLREPDYGRPSLSRSENREQRRFVHTLPMGNPGWLRFDSPYLRRPGLNQRLLIRFLPIPGALCDLTTLRPLQASAIGPSLGNAGTLKNADLRVSVPQVRENL